MRTLALLLATLSFSLPALASPNEFFRDDFSGYSAQEDFSDFEFPLKVISGTADIVGDPACPDQCVDLDGGPPASGVLAFALRGSPLAFIGYRVGGNPAITEPDLFSIDIYRGGVFSESLLRISVDSLSPFVEGWIVYPYRAGRLEVRLSTDSTDGAGPLLDYLEVWVGAPAPPTFALFSLAFGGLAARGRGYRLRA